MNTRHLLAFKYVSQFGSVTQAAELLHVTQSAVSQMITNLETDLGFQLFERRQGKMASATPQGRRFLLEAESVIGTMEKARRAAIELKDLSFGNFRIAATSAFAMSLLPKPIARFNNSHPEINASLRTHHSADVRDLVASRIFDVGVCELSEPVLDVETRFFTAYCSFICRADDPLSELSVVTPKDLTERTIITPYDQNPTTIALRDAFRDQGVEWRSHVASNLYGATCQMVLHGGGVAWSDPFTLAMLDDPALCVRRFEPAIPLRFGILKAPPQEKKEIAAAEMVALISEEIESICD